MAIPLQNQPYNQFNDGYGQQGRLVNQQVIAPGRGIPMQPSQGGMSSIMPVPNQMNNTALQQRLQPGLMQPPQAGISPNQGMQTMAPQQNMAQPQYGLSGSEQAISQGLGAGISALEQGQQSALQSLGMGNQQAMQQLAAGRGALGGNFGASAVNVDPMTGQPLFQQAAQGVGAYSPAGLQAQELQSALSGAQGQEAFNQALINSPIQKFLQEQGAQTIAGQQAASGGLGSGEFQKELAQFGQGLAGTQLQQQIQNLQALSGQGLQAAGQQGQFLSQAGQQQGQLAGQNAQLGTQANIASAANRLGAAGQMANLFGQGAGISSALASQGAGFQNQAGMNAANMFMGAGQNLAQNRFQTGRDLASQISGVSGGLANLAGQQGAGLSDIIGQGGSNLANLLSGYGQMSAGQQQQLAGLLSNLATGTGSQLANQQGQIGQAQAGGILGGAGAIGGTIGDIAGGLGSGGLQTGLKYLGGLF